MLILAAISLIAIAIVAVFSVVAYKCGKASGNQTMSIILIVVGFFFFSPIPGILHLIGVNAHNNNLRNNPHYNPYNPHNNQYYGNNPYNPNYNYQPGNYQNPNNQGGYQPHGQPGNSSGDNGNNGNNSSGNSPQ